MGSKPERETTRSQAATAAYATDGTGYRHRQAGDDDPPDSGWHATFNRLLGNSHVFMAQTYTQTGMLFRGTPSGLAVAVETGVFWHSPHDNPLCELERELDVIFCSEVARDALAVARPWQNGSKDAAVLIFSSRVYVERWQQRTAAMLGFADVGMVFKYPCLAEPLGWHDLYGLVIHPDKLAACQSQIAGLPVALRPYVAAPAAADVADREAWMTVIDKLLAKEQMAAAASLPAADYPRRLG